MQREKGFAHFQYGQLVKIWGKNNGVLKTPFAQLAKCSVFSYIVVNSLGFNDLVKTNNQLGNDGKSAKLYLNFLERSPAFKSSQSPKLRTAAAK